MAREDEKQQAHEIEFQLGILAPEDDAALDRAAAADPALTERLSALAREFEPVRHALDEAPDHGTRTALLAAAGGGLEAFTPRLSAFLDLPPDRTEEILGLAARPPAQWPDAPAPGVRTQPVATGPRHAEASAYLLLLEPGAEIQRHRHLGTEWGFVLAGTLADDGGDRKAAGDLVHKPAGSVHRVWNPGARAALAINIIYAGYDWEP